MVEGDAAVSVSYERRLLAFVDVLGFEDVVQKSAGARPGLATKIYQAIEEIPVHRWTIEIAEMSEGDEFEKRVGFRQSSFSDCIALSTKPTPEGFTYLIRQLQALYCRLAANGMLSRGAIDIGLLIHEPDKNVIFGPAMNHVVHLERDIARYPRLILGRDAVEWRRRLLVAASTEDWRRDFVANQFDQCSDGPFCLSVFGEIASELTELADPEAESSMGEDWYSYSEQVLKPNIHIATRIRRHIEVQLQRAVESPKVFEKLVWIARHYNQTFSRLEGEARNLVKTIDLEALL